jgi:hypothetical protein
MRFTTYARMYSLFWKCFDRARTKETSGDYNLIFLSAIPFLAEVVKVHHV